MNAAEITRALGGRWHGRYGMVRCPAHHDRTPSLSITNGTNGRLLVRCYAGCDGCAVLAALRGLGLLQGARAYHPDPAEEVRRAARERREAARRARQARECWEASVSAKGTLAERYLRARAYDGPIPGTLRFNAECWHQSGRHLPAMVAAVERGGELVAVHRTYLAEPGQKANIDFPKAALGPVGGGAVRLSAGVGRLVIAEGIETALSLLDLMRGRAPRMWASLGTSGMKTLVLPERPREISIAPDPGERGRKAAEVLAQRAHKAGWHVWMIEPPEGGGDWNDAAMAETRGAAA
jgi:hypothetical protein